MLLARVREGQVVGSRSAEDDGRGFALAEAVQAGELVRAIGRKSCKVRSAGLRVGCLGASAIRLSAARWTSGRGHSLMLSLGPEGTMHTGRGFADFLRGREAWQRKGGLNSRSTTRRECCSMTSGAIPGSELATSESTSRSALAISSNARAANLLGLAISELHTGSWERTWRWRQPAVAWNVTCLSEVSTFEGLLPDLSLWKWLPLWSHMTIATLLARPSGYLKEMDAVALVRSSDSMKKAMSTGRFSTSCKLLLRAEFSRSSRNRDAERNPPRMMWDVHRSRSSGVAMLGSLGNKSIGKIS